MLIFLFLFYKNIYSSNTTPRQQRPYSLPTNWLRQKDIDPRRKGLLLGICTIQSRQGSDDSRVPGRLCGGISGVVLALELPDLAAGFEAVHDRHGDVYHILLVTRQSDRDWIMV